MKRIVFYIVVLILERNMLIEWTHTLINYRSNNRAVILPGLNRCN